MWHEMKSEVACVKLIAYYAGVLSVAKLLEVFSVFKGIFRFWWVNNDQHPFSMRTTLTEHAQDSVSSQQDCFTFKEDPLHQNAIPCGNIKILSFDIKSTGQFCHQKVSTVN